MRAGHSAWLLRIFSVWMCVCPLSRLLITSGVIWTPYDWLIKLCGFYIVVVVFIDDGHGLGVEVRHINQPNKSKLSLHKPLLSL